MSPRAAHAWVRRWWAGEAGAAGRLLTSTTAPLEFLFGAAVRLRRAGYRAGLLRTGRAPVPVVSVGNLVVGGTGKTPMAAWVVGTLEEAGRRPALVARGYGADELLLHQRWNPGAPVVADPDRHRGVHRAAALGAASAVLDDGFQHLALARDLDVVLLAAEHPFPGSALPRGPYREGPDALARADVVVLTSRVAAPGRVAALVDRVRPWLSPGAVLAEVRLEPGGWTDLGGRAAPAPSGPVLAVAGVAAPGGFGDLVEAETGERPELMAWPDHHAFGPADVRRIARRAGGRTVAVTEKDAVKLAGLAVGLPPVRVLRLALRFVRGEGSVRRRVLAATAAAAPGVEARP